MTDLKTGKQTQQVIKKLGTTLTTEYFIINTVGERLIYDRKEW